MFSDTAMSAADMATRFARLLIPSRHGCVCGWNWMCRREVVCGEKLEFHLQIIGKMVLPHAALGALYGSRRVYYVGTYMMLPRQVTGQPEQWLCSLNNGCAAGA
jgi:hypothetical protein